MNRLKRAAILSALASKMRKKGSWCGETHLQKAVYVLQDLRQVPTHFDYMLYKHGPFSFDLRDELTSLRADNLFALEPQPAPYGPKLLPSESADRLQQRFPKTMEQYRPHLEFVARRLSDKGVSELEKVATALYVTKREGSRHSVHQRAKRLHELKPHIAVPDAETAVSEVDQLIVDARGLLDVQSI